MTVAGEKLLRQFYGQHHVAEKPLRTWLTLMKANQARNLPELKRTFGSVDYVPVGNRERYIFNIGGNKYRLVAQVDYKLQTVLIRHVLTHQEYDRGDWRKNP